MQILDPTRFDEASVSDLLTAAQKNWIGIDQRLVRSLMNRGPAGGDEVLAFARAVPEDDWTPELNLLITDLLRHYRPAGALDELIQRAEFTFDDIGDELFEAIVPFGAAAVEPLLNLYEEIGEDGGSEIAFLLTGLQVRDPRIFEMLLDRLEFDAADGAFLLGMYGDPQARPALEAMLGEIPEEDAELRREITFALQMLREEPSPYQVESVDIAEGYPKTDIPNIGALSEEEALALLASPDAETRAAAASGFFNQDLEPAVRDRLLEVARNDPDAKVRGRAWASLADATGVGAGPVKTDAQKAAVAAANQVRDEMVAIARDAARDPMERAGAIVGLHGVADDDPVTEAIEALYQEGGKLRAAALEAMWRSLWKPFAQYFAGHVNDPDPEIVRQSLRGVGYFGISSAVGDISKYFASADHDEEQCEDPDHDHEHDHGHDSLREDALMAYAMAMPGQTSRGRVHGMLRKIDELANLSPFEVDLVRFALDERLQLHGLEPVFSKEEEAAEAEQAQAVAAAAESVPAAGRNDPCPCGSGKKYKKCHGG